MQHLLVPCAHRVVSPDRRMVAPRHLEHRTALRATPPRDKVPVELEPTEPSAALSTQHEGGALAVGLEAAHAALLPLPPSSRASLLEEPSAVRSSAPPHEHRELMALAHVCGVLGRRAHLVSQLAELPHPRKVQLHCRASDSDQGARESVGGEQRIMHVSEHAAHRALIELMHGLRDWQVATRAGICIPRDASEDDPDSGVAAIPQGITAGR